MKNGITREQLKNNFLKNIIVRFDYTGIAEVELDNIIANIKPMFKASGYNKLQEEYLTEMDFELQDPETLELNGVPIKDIRKQKAYVFTNESRGMQCKLCTKFAFLAIQSQKYITFSEYSKTIIELMTILRDSVEFLYFNRFGVRKVNQCILKDISLIDLYFEKHCFQVYGAENGILLKLNEAKDCYMDGQYNINFARTIIAGEYDRNLAYQMVIDSDIYVTDDAVVRALLEDEAEVENMNTKLFELYTDSLTEAFLEKLCQEWREDLNIIGVEANE